MPQFNAAGIALYALSYDEPDALDDFSEAHNISYTFLSDPDSQVIRSFGLLNTLIDPNDHPWFGIPYPGTYILDEQGIITNKFFDNNLAVRVGPEQLLLAATGERLEVTVEPGAHDQSLDSSNEMQSIEPEVQVRVELDGEHLSSSVQHDLVAHFRVPPGRHVYAEPAPQGSIAVDLTLETDERIVTRALKRPLADHHRLLSTQEEFGVHHNSFELRLPITVNNALGGADEITLRGELCWQTCDDEVCDIPKRQAFELTLPVSKAPANAIGNTSGMELEPNAMSHFQKMTTRRGSSS